MRSESGTDAKRRTESKPKHFKKPSETTKTQRGRDPKVTTSVAFSRTDMPRWLLPESISDVLPSEARAIEMLRRRLLDLYRTYGYELVMPPLLEQAREDRNVAGAAGVNFLMLLGYTCGGWLLGQSALKASVRLASGGGDAAFLKAKMVTARFYCEHWLPRTSACLAAIQAGPDSMMALTADQL